MFFTLSNLIALYARLSKDRSGLSENVQIQLREGEAFVEDAGGKVALRFKDNDTSASPYSKKPRPDYDLLVAAIERGEVEIIVVTEMTRLYRRLEELLELIKMAERTQLRGIWTTDGISYDLSTPEGIHAAIAVVNNAMLESAKISKREKRNKKARAEAGVYLGGQRAYGYECPIKDKDGNITNRGRINVAVVEHEKQIWLDCVERVIAGEPELSLVQSLNQQSIPSTNGKQWAVPTLKRTLTNRRYVIFDDDDPEQRGTLVHNSTEYRAVWPGFITRQRHELLVARFRDNSLSWGQHGQPKARSYLLTGDSYCGRCGAPCRGQGRNLPAKSKKPARYQRRYQCRKYDNYGAEIGCGGTYRDADALEAFVTEQVLERFDSPDVARALAPTERADEVEALVNQLAHYRQRRSLLLREYSLGEHEKADFEFMRDNLDGEIDHVERQLAKLQSERAAGLLPTNGRLRDVWEENTIEWRRAVMRLVVVKVVIHPGRSGSTMWNGHRFEPKSVEIVWRH